MVISSPKLLSSSAKISATPLESPDVTSPGLTKAFEKMSGSTSKMSMRWKKLGFRKGPSFSGDEVTPFPLATPPVPKSAQTLEDPIALARNIAPRQDLQTFRFPPPLQSAISDTPPVRTTEALRLPSPPGTANPTTGLKQMMGKLRRGKSDDQTEASCLQRSPSAPRPSRNMDPLEPPPAAINAKSAVSHHSPSSSDDSAVAKFIAAGRAVGLNTEQLNEMLAANEMLQRSGTISSSRSYQSTAPTTTSFSQSQPSPSPVSPSLGRMPSFDKESKGLFRSLSKPKKSQPNVQGVADVAEEPRNVVVRRTLLMPEPLRLPETPTVLPSPGTHTNSPDSSASRPPAVRKQSIKRKPLNLTQEDRELVSNSPKSHQRSVSEGTIASIRSNVATNGGDTTGLGFLHPDVMPDGIARDQSRDSSVSARSEGSLYDLYGEEPLQPRLDRRPSEQGGSNQAVEIT
jgi:hypothetical protein